MESRTILAVLIGLLAFAVALLFDWVSTKKIANTKFWIICVFLSLHAYAIYLALWDAKEFSLPFAVSILGWVLVPIFSFLLVYSLVIELPLSKTYSKSGASGDLVKTGTYALTRHPGIIWYILGLASLILATQSTVLLIAAPVWSLINIAYAVIEDKVLFVKMFPGYIQYQQETPMLVPTWRSIEACFKTFRNKSNLTPRTQIS